jgi:hypothetical protein
MCKTAHGPTQPPIPWVLRIFLEVKRTEREVNHSPPSGSEVTKECCCTSNPHICAYDVDRGNVYIFLLQVKLTLKGTKCYVGEL